MKKQYKMQSRTLQFPGQDGIKLSASLDYPQDYPQDSQPMQTVIMSHCFTCSRQTITTARLSRGLAEAGMIVLRVDFTGLGDSEGDFSTSHFRSMLLDIECAADFLQQHYQPASVLVGHSMGGTACLAASQSGARSLAGIKRIVTIASPAYPAHVLHHFGSAMAELQQGRETEITVAGRAYPVKPGFVEDVLSFDMVSHMRNCTIPVMAVRAGADALIGAEAADDILLLTQGERKLLQIDAADHLFSDREHAAQLLDAVRQWLI